MKKIIKVMIDGLIVCILLYCIYILALFLRTGRRPSFFGYKTFIVLSGSMEDYLNIGDVVFVKEVKQSKIKVNDVISFTDGKTVVTHRIVEIKDGKYITKGDHNNTIDEGEVSFDQIEGVMAFKIPKIGNLLLNQKTMIIGVCILISVLLIISYIK